MFLERADHHLGTSKCLVGKAHPRSEGPIGEFAHFFGGLNPGPADFGRRD